MKKCVYLSLILSIILITPCLGEKYIIIPPNQQVVISGFNEKEINCTPIYGTNSCSGNLTKEQIKELKEEGYKIYPNLKVYAFLDESVPQIQADKLWNISVNGTNLTGKGQTICIIDTGIDYNHSALGGGWGNKVIAGWRFLDGCTINNQSCNCTYNNSACYDDNGHGTHVAGIIASNNTTYRGVSPDSKLVVVKALNSNGEGTIDNVISGINYCVDHSKEYNISIISMSLGTTDYHNNSYCDAEVPPLTSAINKATAKNISVIVASGNEYNSNAISLPACIWNATPVGSVNGEDSISTLSNYWSLPQIFAPGEKIYSSVPNGSCENCNPFGWKNLYGTSMATPHVAGAFALIRQYLELKGISKTSQELEDLFINTGINIDSNENRSRINPYLTYLNLLEFNVSVIPKKLEFILEPNSTETKNITINSTKNINITITFSNLTNSENQTIDNSNIFAWVDGNLSHNATGNEILTIKNTNSTTININLTAPENSFGSYTGEISINITNGVNSTTTSIIVKANLPYLLKKKIEIQTDCETKNYFIKIGNISNLIVKANFSVLTDSYLAVEKDNITKESNKTNTTENSIIISNPEPGIWNITIWFGETSSGSVNISATQSNNLSGTLIITKSFIEAEREENLSLEPAQTKNRNFTIKTMAAEENVTLSVENYYLTYDWPSQNISNQTAFTFIVPFSSNLTANLTWTNSTNNLTLNLTNLRTGDNFENTSGEGNFLIMDLNTSQVKYGIWRATVFGENISESETFNLTIKFLDNRFKINFTDVKHKFENKEISDKTVQNWTFYVDNNSVVSINVSFISNATNEINLSLYNSTGGLINLTKTKDGDASVFTTNISGGYWTVLINNTDNTTSFSYNLTIHLSGNNITKLGNLTNNSNSVVYFNLTSPENKVVDGKYNTSIRIVAAKNSFELPININLSAPILKLRPKWKENYYIGNQTLTAGEIETYNTTRNLFINLNQTKNLSFIINNTGSLNLTDLTITNSSFNSLLNLTKINLSKINISAEDTAYLNLTVFGKTVGSSSGWVYLNSSNGQPFKYLNLTLNFNITNKTLPRLNKKVYYFESAHNNQLPVSFRIYFYDNQTIDKFWNSSKQYNFSLVNSTDNSQVLQNLTFDVSSTGLFSSNINIANTTFKEGYNYTILGNLTDNANNTAEVNLTFELLHNLNLSVVSNLDSIVKGHPFEFKINISKLGNLSAENVSVTLQLPSTINTTDNLTKSAGNINKTNSKLLNWTLNGIKNGTYTINITASSADGRFNRTIPQNITVRYGNLIVSLDEDETPSSKSVNSSFEVYIKIKNTGDWAAFINKIEIKVCGTTKTLNPSEKKINGGSTKSYHASEFSCTSIGDENIYVKLSGVENATNQYSGFVAVGEITITGSSTQNNGNGNENPTTYYDISFEKFEINNVEVSKIEILQGGTADLKVKVKNTGNAKLHNLYLTLTGLNSSYYSITPSDKRDLSANNTLDFDIHLSIPEDLEAKSYSLTLKAISDEKKETKTIALIVYKLSIEFMNITDLNITQGEQLIKKFKIKNTGDRTLHNIYLKLSGAIITPKKKINLFKNEEKEYEINFSISKNEEIGIKEKILTAISDEKNFTKKFNLTILPCEEEKIRINKIYENLTSKFSDILEKFNNAKTKGKNISSVESKIIEINQTLDQIKDYIERGKYIEAKDLLNSLENSLNSLSENLNNLEKMNSNFMLPIAIIIFAIALSGVVLYYFFLPKNGYLPGKGYIIQNTRMNNFNEKIKNLLKKFKRRKSEEEIARKKKLAEWKKRYNKLKKEKIWKAK